MHTYKKVAYLVVSTFQDTGSVVEYFISRTKEFYLYIFPPSYKNKPTIIKYYKNGKLSASEEIWFYKGNNKIIIHVLYFVYYIYFILKFRITHTYILFYFPIFLFLNSIISLFTANKYVFWIWDYFPTNSKVIKLYNRIVEHYNNNLRFVLYLSPLLFKLYNHKQFKSKKNRIRNIISFGIKDRDIINKKQNNVIGYIGNLRTGQGLESLLKIVKNNSELTLHIIGEGPLRKQIVNDINLNRLSHRVMLHGFLSNDELITIASKWDVAVALYDHGKDNPTFYTDPGKIKLYLELGLPVIMTRVSYIYKQLLFYNAGEVYDAHKETFTEVLKKIQNNYPSYIKGVNKFKSTILFDSYYNKKFTKVFYE